jgi:hypothetical protein
MKIIEQATIISVPEPNKMSRLSIDVNSEEEKALRDSESEYIKPIELT